MDKMLIIFIKLVGIGVILLNLYFITSGHALNLTSYLNFIQPVIVLIGPLFLVGLGILFVRYNMAGAIGFIILLIALYYLARHFLGFGPFFYYF
jgi:hypothetical protein